METDFNGQNAFNITDRRRFLKNISVVSAAFATTDLWTMTASGQENMSFVNSGAVPRRAFGRTGVQVSNFTKLPSVSMVRPVASNMGFLLRRKWRVRVYRLDRNVCRLNKWVWRITWPIKTKFRRAG